MRMTAEYTTCDILNLVPDFKNWSYLELGVGNNLNFEAIKCASKMSVDMEKNAMWKGTTDDYFKQLPIQTKFDVIFIDACHHYEFVLRDFNNSTGHCNKWIIMHDMIPPTEAHTTKGRCSDGYKLLHHMIGKTSMQIYPMLNPSRLGLTFIKMPGTRIAPSPSNKDMTYLEFSSWVKTVRLYEENEIIEILN